MSVLNQSGDEQAECPLCMEPLEVDDLNFYPCTCGYQICRFCWNRIREGENGLCPACRKAYPENPADFTPLSQEQVAALKTEKRAREQQRRNKSQESRRQLSSVRVVQKNLVFVVGLPVRLADPEILKRPEYFGKYGKIHKVVINHSTTYAGSQGPSASAYVTYVSSADALRAIQNVNNVTIDGRVLKGSLGTTKYCANFMRNQPCPKPDCMYLHELGDSNASFTKEEMHQGLHQMYEKKLHEQLIAATAAAANSTGGGNSNGSGGGAGGPGNSIMLNGNHTSSSNGPSSNSSSTSSLNSSGGGGSTFIPSAVVTSSSINIHNAKSKSNSSNGGSSGGVMLSSSSSSTSSSCSRDTWPSLGSSSPPLHSDTQDSNPSPVPSSNSNQQLNNSSERQSAGNKQHGESSTAPQPNGKSSNNKTTSKSNNKENTNTTNQNSGNTGTSKGNNSKKANKSKKETEKQGKANKKEQSGSHSNNTEATGSGDKKKADKDKNKSAEQNSEATANEKAFKTSQTQQPARQKQSSQSTDLDADERHSLIDGHDLLEGSDHSLLEDDDHGLLKDSPPRNMVDNGSINLLKKHPDMLNMVGPQSLFKQHGMPPLKDFSGLEGSREHQQLFNNPSVFLEKEMLLLRERQQKEMLLKQEYLARQQLFNAINSDPTKYLNLDPKEQLLLQQRLRQHQQQNIFSPFGMRADGTLPQQFGLQQQIPNQSRINGLINDSNHILNNGIESHGQGLANSLSSGNLASNMNAPSGLANSLSATNLSSGSKLLGVGSGNLGAGISEGRYVGENNMDRFFLDFHRNQQLKGSRSGPLLPPEAPSLTYIESQALQRRYGLMQNGIQDAILGQQLSQLHSMGGNMFPTNNQQNGPIGNGGMPQQANGQQQQQQQQTGNNLSNGLASEGQTPGNGASQNNREDDLDFEWLNERQKLFAELIENDMMLQQGHPNYNENVEAMQQRARHPPQGFTHMNAFGIGVPRPQQAAGLSQNTGMVSDWTQMDPAIVASGLCSNTAQQQQQQNLMARFRNINLQQQQLEAQRLQNGLGLPHHNLLTAQQQLQYQQQQRKLMAAAMAAQQQQQQQQVAQQQQQQQAAQQQQQQQQLPNSFWLLPSEQQLNNYQNRNGFYSTAAQSIQNNGEISQNSKYNIPMSQAFTSPSGNPSVNNAECIESK